MDLYLLKFPYRKVLLPLAKKMKFVDPDILGYLATLVALGTGFCYFFAPQKPILLIISVVLTLFRMTLNTIDGVIAIERGNLRLKGEIVNALPDRYSDIFVVMGIGLSALCNPFLGMLGLSSMFLVSYTGMLSKAIGAQWQHQGPLGKVERLILIMIFSILSYFQLTGKIGNIGGFGYFEWLMILFAVLGQITVFNRLKAQLKECAVLDWIKYRNIDKKVVVVYESQTGNSKKVADSAADALETKAISVNEVSKEDLKSAELVIFAVPHLGRKIIPEKTKEIIENLNVKNYALLTTSGMPIVRIFSNKKCIDYFKEKLGKNPVKTINIKGFHAKAKTYKGHPDDKDLTNAYLFASECYEKL